MKPIKIDKVPDSTIETLYNWASTVIEQARETTYRQVNEVECGFNYPDTVYIFQSLKSEIETGKKAEKYGKENQIIFTGSSY